MGPAPLLTDPAVFAEFYREHVENVLRFVTRRVADPETAADLTAEVFFAVLASARYCPQRGAQRAWLFGIARNQIAGNARRAARERDRQHRVAGRRLLDVDDIDRLVERIDAAQEARELMARIAMLPEHERAVLELVAVDGLEVTEAARALDIPAGTARMRLFRARRALRSQPGLSPSDAASCEETTRVRQR